MDLVQISEKGNRYFAPDTIIEISDLALDAFFDPHFSDFKQPEDTFLQQVLEDIIVENTTTEQRTAYFRCWAAERASFSCNSLFRFLHKDFPINVESLQREKNHLERLLAFPLTGDLEYQTTYLIEALSKRIKTNGR